MHSWVDIVGYLDFYALLSNPGLPQAQRTLRGCSYDPTPRSAGLDHKLSPFGNRFQVAFHGYGTAKNSCSDTKESFLFGGLSPPNKKITSLRPRRLCGENSILDKNAQIYYSQKYQEGNRQGHFVAILA